MIIYKFYYLFFFKGHNIYHGMYCTEELSWIKLTRDLIVDLQKGLNLLKKTTTKMFRSKYKVLYE